MHVRYPAESKEIDNIVLRSFVYWRKLACSTVSLTRDRGRGDDSKQYRYYKSTYSTVQVFFFQQPAHPRGELFRAPPPPPPPAIPLNCPPRTSGSAAVLRRYIEQWNGNRTHRRPSRIRLPWSFNRRVQIFNPFPRTPISAGVRGLVKKKDYCITKQGFFLTESHEISIAS